MPASWLTQYQIKAEPVLPEELRPEATQPDKYWRPLSEPLFRPRSRAFFAAFVASGLAYVGQPSANEVYPDKWYRELERPTPKKPALRAALQQAFATDPTTPVPAETITVDKWFQSFSEPLRVKRPLPRGAYQSFANDLTIPLPTVDMWFRGLDRPTPSKPAIRVALRQYFATDTSTPAVETVTLDKWFAELSKPVRRKAALGASQQQAFSTDPTITTPPPGWYREFEYPRSKPGLRRALVQSYATDPNTPAVAETVTADKWLRPLAEPMRKKVLVYAVAPVFAFVGVVVTVTAPATTAKFEGFRRNVGRLMR